MPPSKSKSEHLHQRPLFFLLLLLFGLPVTGGLLSFIQVLRDGVDVDGLRGPVAVAVSPDGGQVYAVGQDDNSLVVFSRDAMAETLTLVEVHQDGVDGIFGLLATSDVAASQDGRHVYITAEIDDTLAVFSRDASTDDLTFVAAQVQEDNVGSVHGLNGASSLAISPDDELVFVSARVDDALAVFSRDATTDDLTFVEAELDGVNGVTGLDGASGVAVSPDGKHVYVAADLDDSVVVFSRQSPASTIVFASRVTQGVGATEGLDGASDVAIDPLGLHVYVASRVDDAVALFERDAASGTLTFLAVYRDGEGGIGGLNGARSVVLNAAGDRLLVAGTDDNALAIFRRDATGELHFLEVIRDGEDGNDGLAGAWDLALKDDDAFVAARDENAIAFFDLALCVGDEAMGDTDEDAFCDDVDLCMGDDFEGDGDEDGVCDDLDACPGFDDSLDDDSDEVPDSCDVCTGQDAVGDADVDGVCDDEDICPGFSDGLDADSDGVPNGCDFCLGDDATGDTDADTICDNVDTCPDFNDFIDDDGDGVADGCDLCPGFDDDTDADADNVADGCDLCPGFDDSVDSDGDSVADGCDICTGDDETGDVDGDGLCADSDCDDNDATNACEVFSDGFESGNITLWSSALGNSP